MQWCAVVITVMNITNFLPDGRQDVLNGAQRSSVPPSRCVTVGAYFIQRICVWHYNSPKSTAVPKDMELSLEACDGLGQKLLEPFMSN